jgi:hypothetical protein
MLFKEINAIYSEKRTKHNYKELLNVKAGGIGGGRALTGQIFCSWTDVTL